MIRFEELNKRFPTENIAPYGEVLVIPGPEFDPDWEFFLGEQGCKCYMIDLHGQPVTLVKVKKAEGKGGGEKQVYSPQARPVAAGDVWTPKDDETLIQLWNRRTKVPVIALEFPNRSRASVSNRIRRLIRKGTIKPRWRRGQGKRREKAKKSTAKRAEKTVPESTPGPPALAPAITTREQGDNKPDPLRFTTTINVEVHVDCSNPAAVDAFLKFLKEVRA